PSNPNVFYGTSHGSAVFYRSENAGVTWTTHTGGILSGESAPQRPGTVAVDPQRPGRLLFGLTRLYLSTDRGNNSAPVGGPDTTGWTSAAPVTGAAFAASDPNTLYAGTNDGRIFVTTDGGATWQQRDPAGLTGAVEVLRVDPGDARTAYAYCNGRGAGRVWRTTDGGATWANLTSNLPLQDG